MQQEILSIANTLNSCYVPIFAEGSERPCVDTDFSLFKLENEQRLTLVYKSIVKNPESYVTNDLIIPLFTLIGENSGQYYWNTVNTVDICQKLLTLALNTHNVVSYSELLVTGSKPIKPAAKRILLNIREKLSKDKWKLHPAAIQCYIWVLKGVNAPFLSDLVHEFIPTTLSLIDDYVDENQILGVQCVFHILQNVTIADLRCYGIGDLIYKAVEPLLRKRKKELVDIVIPCVLLLINRTEGTFLEEDHKWLRSDDILDILLDTIEYEHLIAIRGAYIRHLKTIVKEYKGRILRWYKRILGIVEQYTEVAVDQCDYCTLREALEILRLLLLLSKKHYGSRILCILVKVWYLLECSNNVSDRTDSCSLILQCKSLVIQTLSDSERQTIYTELSRHLDKNKYVGLFSFLN